mgnify:CR=1 FL=1
MEIIKPGEIRKIKLKCDECGCEFTCTLGELTHIYGTAWAECPQEGCHNVVEVPNGIPEHIEPANHTVIGTIAVVLSGATVTEEPVGDERYITRVTNVSKEAAEHIKALGADTSISLMVDGKYRYAYRLQGPRWKTLRIGVIHNGNKETYRHRKSKG